MIYGKMTPGSAIYLGKTCYFSNDIEDFNRLQRCKKSILTEIDYDYALVFKCSEGERYMYFTPCPT